MTKEEFRRVIDLCSNLPDVREEVLKNHDNNLWWPKSVLDYRLRLIIAGLSTRISYNMINSYIKIIDNLCSYTYEQIKNMQESEIKQIIKGLGLFNTRYKYIKSIINFIDNHSKSEIFNLDNSELIKLISNEVDGASYKVGECCALYVKGYYCGIMPVDSGMKDMELPCLGFKKYNKSDGNYILSMELQTLTNNNDMSDIIKKNGYSDLNIPDYKNATWWVHLVLIYFKRCYCNKHNPDICPLRQKVKVQSLCNKK